MADATPRILLLVPTTSYRAGDFLDAAGRQGAIPVVGSDQPPVLAEASGRGLGVDLSDAAAACRQITAFHAAHPLSAIVGVDEGTAAIAARASAALGLPHNPPDAVAAASHKARFRDALAAAGVPQPSYRIVGPDADPPAAARGVNHYPVVLKPVGLAGSRGVIRAEDADDFAEAVARIRRIAAATDPATGLDPDPTIVAESYMPGAEVALEGLMIGGELHTLALFDKPGTPDGPTFPETVFVTPSRHDAATQRAIRQRTADAVAALGLTDGPVHAELRLTPDEGPVPLEVAPRAIGGLCGRVLRFGTGLGLEDLIVRHALGQPPDDLAREAAAAGVMMLPVPRAGRLARVDGVDAARAVDGITAVDITIAPGTAVTPLPDGDRYLGFIFARGGTPADVEDRLQSAAAAIAPVIDPAGVR